MKRLSLSVLLFPVFISGFAQQNMLTLPEAIGTALQNNYDIRLTRIDSASFSIDRSYVYAAFLPRINATAGKLWNVNAQKQELANGTKRDTTGLKSNNLTAAVNLNWTLFDGLRMFATRDKLYELERLGSLNVKIQVVNTVASVINGYFNIVRQKQQLKAIEEQMSINEERVKLAEKKLSVGLGAKPELLQARVDLNAQRAAHLQEQTLVEQLKEILNQLMAVDLTMRYEVMDSIPINTDLQYGQLEADIAASNPTILAASKNVDIARLTLKERKGEQFPILSFNSAYNFSRAQNNTVINTFTPLFNQNRGFNYGFGLSVPILNGLNSRRLIEQARLDIQRQELGYKYQFSLVNVGLSNSFKDYQLQKQLLTLEEENIGLAKENVMIALERFRQGVSTYLELREAQRSLEDAYNRLIAARYNTKLAETELLRLKGDLVQ